MYQNEQILEWIIKGLRHLKNFLDQKNILDNNASNSEVVQKKKEEEHRLYECLREIIIIEQKEEENKFIKNKNVPLFMIDKEIFIKQIISFLHPFEIMNLCQVSKYFNNLVKSTCCIKYIVNFHSKHKIPIKYDAFSLPLNKVNSPKHISDALTDSYEIANAKLEKQKNISEYLKNMYIENQMSLENLQINIDIIKSIHRIHRNVNKKIQSKIISLEDQIKTNENQFISNQLDNNKKINEITEKNNKLEESYTSLRNEITDIESDNSNIKKEVNKMKKLVLKLELENRKKKSVFDQLSDFFAKGKPSINQALKEYNESHNKSFAAEELSKSKIQ